MEEKDLELLSLLKTNARMPVSEMAVELGLDTKDLKKLKRKYNIK